MKNTTLFSLIFISLPMIGGCQTHTIPPLSKQAVRVVDEMGSPVSNAFVEAYTYWTEGWNSGRTRGMTGINGFFRYEDHVYREIGYMVQKKGFYDSHGEAWWPKKLFEVPETNLVVELKRILEPVKMLHHKVIRQLPRLDNPVSFDLEVGDWVFPDGKGSIADFWVSGTNQWVSKEWYDYYVTLSVTNALDGFMTMVVPSMIGHCLKSELRPIQCAPAKGYDRSLEFHGGKHKEATGTRYFESIRDDRVYLFRVRSVTNEVGELVSANVGWLEGNGTNIFRQKEDGSLGIALEYYFNPDPTSRSLEPKELSDQQARGIPKDMK